MPHIYPLTLTLLCTCFPLLWQNDGLSQFSQTQNRQRKLIRRMTRFMSRASPSALQDRLCTYFEGMRYKCDRGPSYQLSISLPNVGKKMPLRFAVRLYPMPLGVYLVEFRLAKGDGLQFKRLFKQTKETLTDLVAADIDCAKTWLNPMIDLGPGNFVPIFKKK
ncbi:hypothetical protein SARC_07861 [Sphaeroforma arctica JP610]|uniref:Uncharacterized protein n=1 Tax=Sphaeroforma arctica JP610 TaxID=667725 RepID=A0A0L0FST2_9EUKA|nr:hypothetical protein SARC_07861 [Sphaeroforma arctica JP610]KNC79749.1 hypothetical protein SARC_07861 [Sphaeroforma arctica JP610]|eukprot:XP_014153651.1 hypothetical protein SARC_07861 [Sphaeroforma arctica JP610]